MRHSKTPDIALQDRAEGSAQTRQEQVYHSLRCAMTDGLLALGAQLPSSRELAQRWGMSRGTVEQVYERLVIEGYLLRRQGAGTFVAGRLPEHFLPAQARNGRPAAPQAMPPALVLTSPGAIRHCSQLRLGQAFASPLADPALLDMDKWRRYLQQATRHIGPALLQETPYAGLPALREAIAAYVRLTRRIDCSAEDIVVTTGVRQALSLVADMLAGSEQLLQMEDPSYVLGRRVFEARKLAMHPVPVDGEGLVVSQLQAQAGGAVYVTPAHQSPLGVTMSPARRAALLDWARRQGALIIEDDYDSDYSYVQSPPPALKAGDASDQVLYCSSFNKVLYLSLRIGFIIPPRAWRADIVQSLRASGSQPGLIEQQALASMIASGDIYSHLRHSRRIYERRRNIVLRALCRHLDAPRLSGEQGGFRFLLWLPSGMDDREVAAALAAEGIYTPPLSDYCSVHAQPPGLIIGFASVPDAQLAAAAEGLGRWLARHA